MLLLRHCDHLAVGGAEPSEVGTRQHCRDNVIMFSRHKVIALLLYLLWLLHLVTGTITFLDFVS